MIGFPLTENNFLLYAAKHYDNPLCFDEIEFLEDIKRFKYLKKLLKKYQDTGVLRERLILNHLIIIFNVFGNTAGCRLLFYHMGMEYNKELKTFVTFLNFMPDKILGIGSSGDTIINTDIAIDMKISDVLRKI